MTAIPLLFLAKAHVKQYTRRDGTVVKEHDDKRQGARPGQLAMPHMGQAPVAGPGRQAAAMPPPGQPPAPGGQGPAPSATQGQGQNPAQGQAPGQPAPAQYGVHNVKPGDRMRFQAGAFQGQGEVVSAGEDGAKIKDAAGREHGVHWHEMQGRQGKGGQDPGQSRELTSSSQGQAQPAKVDEAASTVGANSGVEADRIEAEVNAGIKAAGMDQFFADAGAGLPEKAVSSFKTWDEISAKAEEAQTAFTKLMEGVGKAIDGQSVRFDTYDYTQPGIIYGVGPVKTQESAARKVNSKYGGDWSRLSDLVRGSIGFDSAEEMRDGIEQLKKAGLKLASVPENKFAHPTPAGYRDMNLNFIMPNGVVGELQLHLKPVLDAKNAGHKLYEESRVLEQELRNQVQDAPPAYGDSNNKAERLTQLLNEQRLLYGRAMQKALAGGKKASQTGAQLVKSLRGKVPLLFRRAA